VVQLITKVQFDRPGLEPLVLAPLIALGRQAELTRHGNFEHAAVIPRVLERCLARRGVAGVEVLRIECDSPAAAIHEVAEPDAQVGAVRHGIRVSERHVVWATELESTISGLHRPGEETFAPGGLYLEPGIVALPESKVSGAEVAVGGPFLVSIGRQAESQVVVEPVMALAAESHGVQLVETWRVLVTHHQTGFVAAQTAAAHQQVVVSG
jgi:hypothetical protein